ncbi:MAG: hypothetical protein OXR72_07470 [Gemmatimonadota bacterium]|nr:hypothetical protein [Gemmatimonadota bacterium]
MKKSNSGSIELNHVTLATGHVRRSRRSDIRSDLLERLRPVLMEALRTGEAVPVPASSWYLSASEVQGRLTFRLWYREPSPFNPDAIRCTVRPEPNGRVPLLEKSMTLADHLRTPISALMQASVLECGVAWAWLDISG